MKLFEQSIAGNGKMIGTLDVLYRGPERENILKSLK